MDMEDLDNVVGAIQDIAKAIRDHAEAVGNLSHAVHRLGVADALTPMGALEAHGKILSEAIQSLRHD